MALDIPPTDFGRSLSLPVEPSSSARDPVFLNRRERHRPRPNPLDFTIHLRGLAIVAVVAIHSAGLSMKYPNMTSRWTWWVANLLTFSTKWAVPLFVMLSGALLLNPRPSVGKFLRQRLLKIGIPLVFWHLFYIFLIINYISPNKTINLIQADFLRGRSFTALYFFWLILGLYACAPLIWPIIESRSLTFIRITGVVMVATTCINQSLSQFIESLSRVPVVDQPTIITQFLPYLGYFILGYGLREIIIHGKKNLYLALFITCLLLVELTWQVRGIPPLTGTTLRILNIITPVDYQGGILALSAVGIFIVIHSWIGNTRPRRESIPRRILRFLGEKSFGVYASHLFVLTLLTSVPVLRLSQGAQSLPSLGILCLGTLSGALALTVALERIPLLKRVV